MASKKDLPSKKYINLATKEQKEMDLRILIPAVLIIIALAVAFAKFAVLDRFAKVASAQGELAEYQTNLALLQAQLVDYDSVLEEYKKYSIDWMDDTEKEQAQKTDIIDMVDSEILQSSQIRSLNINANTINLELVGLTLKDTSKLVDRLYARSDIADVQVSTATTEEAEENQVIVSLTVIMKLQEEGDAQ